MNLRNLSRRAVTAASAACLAAGALFVISATPASAATASAPAALAQGALFGVSATSATNALAVGYRFGGQADRTLTLHWNGRSWRQIKSLSPVVLSDGQYVAGRWTVTGTNTGPFDLFGLPPAGRPVTMTGQQIFRAEAGKLVEIWHSEDAPGMLRQLGLGASARPARLGISRWLPH